MKKLLLIVLTLSILSAGAFADELLRVEVNDAEDAEMLKSTGAAPVARLTGAYLVLVKETDRIAQSGLKYSSIATGVTLDELALDNRLDAFNVGLYPLLYEEGNFRLYRVNLSEPAIQAEQPSLAPVKSKSIHIKYTEPRAISVEKLGWDSRDVTLDSLISLASEDSLTAWLYRLEAFYRRTTGSDSNYASRDWIAGKFADFGYDSIIIDSFLYSGTPCMNVVAVKEGTRFPDHQIVIGAHRDAVSSSPGADDNGSGTIAVLEIARILKDIDTDMTMIFALFDAEEQGLHGSYHYADEADANGDNIVYMFNMDMIAYLPNDSDITVYHGSDTEYSILYNQLADSLVGITGHLAGNIAASDHYPFSQKGWPVTFPIEYIFSSVYHTYQDSTTYCNFDYMTRVCQSALATCYTVSQTAGPAPAVAFDYPEGRPEIVPPGGVASFEVNVGSLYDGVPVSGTGQIYVSVDYAPFTATAMTETSSNVYLAELSGGACNSFIRYYFSAEEATEGIYYDGSASEPYVAYVATQKVTAFFDGFETDLGWSLNNLWARGNPSGNGGDHGNPDPNSPYEGFSELGYNLNGDYQNNLPETHATSPAINCTGLSGVTLRFWRWLGVETDSYDHAYVKVSSNGVSWQTIWENDGEVADGSWSQHEFDISAYADGQATVYIRFTMGETDGSWQYCGWNIDNVEVFAYSCDAVVPNITTPTVPDWTEGRPYTFQIEAQGGTGNITFADKYGDLTGTGLGLGATGMLAGTPSSAGLISFTAEATDEADSTDEKVFSFTINDPVEITTASLPAWTVGLPYSEQLAATGGTGPIQWEERNNNLSVYGLGLSPAGLVSGTPSASGTVSFTANANDSTLSLASAILSIDLNPWPVIETTTLPDGEVDEAYSQSLTATGGTGGLTWSDKNGDLTGTGLALTSGGVLSGTVVSEQTVSFTAEVVDNLGASTDQAFSFTFSVPYICGDADNSGSGPDIADLVFLVAYMFSGGPEPPHWEAVDVDGNGNNGDIADLVYLVAYMFNDGPALQCP